MSIDAYLMGLLGLLILLCWAVVHLLSDRGGEGNAPDCLGDFPANRPDVAAERDCLHCEWRAACYLTARAQAGTGQDASHINQAGPGRAAANEE